MLTEEVAVEADIVLSYVEVVANLDFIFAKAFYSKLIKATIPIVNNDRYMDLRQARHPLIDPEINVPNNIMLGKDFTTIVITGPTTGGKTGTLKTVG
ncbi:endonuclease MutS2, partial [Bacillus cereus]|nr:endonuclease MutS2 [Bacillus cereus]